MNKTTTETKFSNDRIAIIETSLKENQVSEQSDSVKYISTIFNFDDSDTYLIINQYISSNNEYKTETFTERKNIFSDFNQAIEDQITNNEYSLKEIFNL